jgi:O-antigen/teichoic acid export membrane protein
VTGLLESVNNVALANLSAVSADGAEASKSAFERIRRVYIYLAVPGGLALMLSSRFIIDLLATKEYSGGIVPLAILGGSFLVQGLYSPYGVAVTTLVEPWYRLVSLSIGVVGYFVALIPLAYVLHLNGVAISVVSTWAVQMGLSIMILKKVFTLSMDTHALRVVILPSVLLLGATLVGQSVYYHLYAFPVYLGVGLAAYAIVFLRGVSDEDLGTIRLILPPEDHWVMRLGVRAHELLGRSWQTAAGAAGADRRG